MTPNASAARAGIRMTVLAALRLSAPRHVSVGLLVGAATFAALSAAPPRYHGEAKLAILAKSDARSISGSQGLIAADAGKDAVDAHIRALTSRELIGKIVDELQLKDEREFNPALGPVDIVDRIVRALGLDAPLVGKSERDLAINAFRHRLDVYPSKEAGVIGVRFTSRNRVRAAAIATVVAETYQAMSATRVADAAQRAALQAEIDKLATDAAAADAEIDRTRSAIGASTDIAQKANVDAQQLSELSEELTRAAASRGEADARAKEARDMMKLGSADALPDVRNSPLIRNLMEQRARVERQISELAASLLPGHPRMQQLNAELEGINRHLKGETAKVVETLESAAKIAQGREDGLRKTLDGLRRESASEAPNETKLRKLQDDAKTKRGELERLRSKHEAANAEAAPAFEAHVISEAQVPAASAFPHRAPMSALVAAAWMLLGTAWTMTRALLAGGRGGALQADDVELGPTFASHDLPASSRAAQKVAAAVEEAADAKPPEGSIAELAMRIARGPQGAMGHRSLITGETGVVDASAEAVDLANALAAAGLQVVLLDWSRSGKPMSGVTSLQNGPGLSELLLGQARFEDVVVRGTDGGAHFIRCGAALKSTDIDPDLLNLVLDALDEAYQHIVVVGPHDDARALFEAIEGRFDAAVAVAEAGAAAPKVDDPSRWFLGFEVTEMDVMRFERKLAPTAVSSQRLARVMRRSGAAA